eukprot:scaffold859_cov306-Pinguiococcus_pyrenoidosus.AAC.6
MAFFGRKKAFLARSPGSEALLTAAGVLLRRLSARCAPLGGPLARGLRLLDVAPLAHSCVGGHEAKLRRGEVS